MLDALSSWSGIHLTSAFATGPEGTPSPRRGLGRQPAVRDVPHSRRTLHERFAPRERVLATGSAKRSAATISSIRTRPRPTGSPRTDRAPTTIARSSRHLIASDDRDAWTKRFRELDLPVMPVYTPAEWMRSDIARERGPVSVDRDAEVAPIDSAGRVSVPHANGRRVSDALRHAPSPAPRSAMRTDFDPQSASGNCDDARARAVRESWTVVEIAGGFGPAMIAAKLLADLGCPVIKLEDRGRRSPSSARVARGLVAVRASERAARTRCASTSRTRARARWSTRCCARRASSSPIATASPRCDRWVPDQPERFPHLTVAACTPFGLRGTLAKWNAGEEGIQAMSGIMSTTHHPGGRPVRVAGAVARTRPRCTR